MLRELSHGRIHCGIKPLGPVVARIRAVFVHLVLHRFTVSYSFAAAKSPRFRMEQANKLVSELMSNPLNMGLVGLIVFLVYKIVRGRKEPVGPVPDPPLPKMKKQDFTLEQLCEYDGTGPEGRVLLAVNGRVFDVTRGKNFYGPS